MGFGTLFVGYMLLLSIPLRSMGICAEVLGYIVMLRALSGDLLGQYQRGFANAKRACFVLLPFGIFSLGLQVLSWLGMDTLYNTVYNATSLVYTVLLSASLLLFHYYLLDGVEQQARDVELTDIVRQAMRNRIMTAVYFILMIAVNFLDIPAVTDVIPYTSLVGVVSLFGVVWIVLNAKMIFNCYMWICLPGDEDMPPREGGGLPNLFNIKKKNKPKSAEEEEAEVEAEYRRRREAYDAEMRARQAARTKKNKRGKKK
ncbi:MAG: hypothetical protein IJ449_11320 [Clostridia bacterium]|nr:hypothetical protein [Clostridia bacterium]